MPRKLSRPDADVEKLATELRKRWKPADGIAPWLRRNGPWLRRMVRDGGWSWTDIGRAMTLAGVVYASGIPWTGALLNVKMAQARSHIRARNAKRDADVRHPRPGPRPPAGTTHEPPMAPRVSADAPTNDGGAEMEPTFALAALAPSPFSPAPPSQAQSGGSKPPPVRRQVDVDEVFRRLQGGAFRQDSED